MFGSTERKSWLSKEQQIPPMFTHYKDSDLGITEQDRAETKPCKCSRFREQLGGGDFKLIPHAILDHKRIELDKKKMFKNLGAL